MTDNVDSGDASSYVDVRNVVRSSVLATVLASLDMLEAGSSVLATVVTSTEVHPGASGVIIGSSGKSRSPPLQRSELQQHISRLPGVGSVFGSIGKG